MAFTMLAAVVAAEQNVRSEETAELPAAAMEHGTQTARTLSGGMERKIQAAVAVAKMVVVAAGEMVLVAPGSSSSDGAIRNGR